MASSTNVFQNGLRPGEVAPMLLVARLGPRAVPTIPCPSNCVALCPS